MCIRDRIQAAQNPDSSRGLDAFDSAFGDHVAFSVANACGGFFHNVTGALFAPAPEKSFDTSQWYRQLARCSRSFAFVADLTVASLGGSLKTKQKLSGRLADAMSAVSYTHLRAHETRHDLVCRLLLEKKK